MRKLAEGEDGVLVELGVHLRNGLVAAHAALLQALHILRNVLLPVLYRLHMHGLSSRAGDTSKGASLRAISQGSGALCLTFADHLSAHLKGIHLIVSPSSLDLLRPRTWVMELLDQRVHYICAMPRKRLTHPLKLAPIEALGPDLPPRHRAGILPPHARILGVVWPASRPKVAIGRPGRVRAECLQQLLQALILPLCTAQTHDEAYSCASAAAPACCYEYVTLEHSCMCQTHSRYQIDSQQLLQDLMSAFCTDHWSHAPLIDEWMIAQALSLYLQPK